MVLPRRSQDIRRNSAHSLAGELQGYSQQLPRDVRLLRLYLGPMFSIHKPDHTISQHYSCCRPICVREERQLAACRSCYDGLTQPSLGKIILSADDAPFHKIKPIGLLSAPEDDGVG